jgi:hypothetical protein
VDTFLGKEGGIKVLASLALSSQTVGTLLRTPGWQITVLSILEWSTRKVFQSGRLHQISPDFSIFKILARVFWGWVCLASPWTRS